MKQSLILLVFCSLTSLSFSQLTKAEKKKWKKEMKMNGVEGYKVMSQENTRLLLENRALKEDLSAAEEKALTKIAELERVRNERDSIYTSLSENIRKIKGVPKSVSPRVASKGVYYKVQIGAYRDFDLTKYFGNHKNFGIEEDPDGILKYTLGLFNEESDAERFAGLMQEMGVSGAWVVPYDQNARIAIKDAL